MLKNFPGIAKNFEVKCDLMSVYDDGATKLTGNPLVIIVHKGGNRTFKVIGKEAKVSKDKTSSRCSAIPFGWKTVTGSGSKPTGPPSTASTRSRASRVRPRSAKAA